MTDAPEPVSEVTAARMASCIQLEDVALLEVHAKLAGVPPASGDISYRVATVRVLWTRSGDGVSAAFPFAVELGASSAEAEPKPFGFVRVLLRITYGFREGSPVPTDEELRNGVGVLGFMHLWPFLRAEVQSLTVKLGLPPLLLPLVVSGEVPSRIAIGAPAQANADAELAPPAGTAPQEPRCDSADEPPANGTSAAKERPNDLGAG